MTSDADGGEGLLCRGLRLGLSSTTPSGWAWSTRPPPRRAGTVAALYPADQPPQWNSYVTVASADDRRPRAGGARRDVLAEPFDVLDVGPDGVDRRPDRARRSACGSRAPTSARRWSMRRARWPGTTWSRPIPTAAAQFYGGLFGWTFVEMPTRGYPSSRIRAAPTAGCCRARACRRRGCPTSGMPTSTGSLGRVGELGGRALSEPMNVPNGRFARVRRPAGRGVRRAHRRLRRLGVAAD